MSLEVRYLDAPPGAQRNMQVTASNANSISDLSMVASGDRGGPWASLEPFGWPLDGSRNILPDDPVVGFWSAGAYTDHIGILGSGRLGSFFLGSNEAQAQFPELPVIELSFPERYTSTGITFTFSPKTNEFCSDMIIRWYNGDDILLEKRVQPDAPYWTLVQKVESFDKIQVTLLKWNKVGHFAKVQMIEIGQTIVFQEDELTYVHLVNETDPILSDLTVDTMTIQIQDKHDRSLAPQEKQRMDLYRINNGTPALIAAHYITNSSRQAKRSYSFSCQSAVGLLEGTFLGGMYADEDLDAVVADILDGMPYDLGDFSKATITGYLPVCTRREALQQVAFAIGAIISTRGTDEIKFVSLPEGDPTGHFEKGRIFLGGKVETAPRIYKFEAVAHSYIESNETKTLVNGEKFSGETLLTFNEPYHDYELTGGTVLDSGVNHVTFLADGDVILTAKTYVHNTVRHSAVNNTATASERNNVQIIENATLVHGGNVEEIIARLLKFVDMRQTLTQSAVIVGEHTGQKVSADDPWGGTVTGYITSMDSDLTQNGHTAAVTIVGVRTEKEEVDG